MNKLIVPTGYMGSGSSAITDLICEFEGYEAHNNSFEYIFLHCPDGVFDLEDKLLIGNNALRSDEALHSFQTRMSELYHDENWWPANYKKYLHTDFLKCTEEYIEELIQFRSNNVWYMQQKPTWKMNLRNVHLQRVLSRISRGKINISRSVRYTPMVLSFVTAEEFYAKSKKYIYKLFNLMGLEKDNLILDQLLLPHNLWRAEKYFDNNLECFVVERDPRDVFIINKYIWMVKGGEVPYPTDVEEFCKYYRHLREAEKKVDTSHIHRFYFEDLIYKYEESTARICDILNLKPEEHTKKAVHFNPQKSINNTQLFLHEEYRKEAKVIEERLAEYLYDFPYVRETEVDKVF